MKETNRKILALVLSTLMLFQIMPMSLIGSALAEIEYYGTEDSPGYVQVRFLDWDDSEIVTQFVQSGYEAVPPEDPTREDYKFIGWLPSSLAVTENTDFTARYALLQKLHITINYVYDIGTPLAGQTAAPAVDQYFEKEGYSSQSFYSPDVVGYRPNYISLDVDINDFDDIDNAFAATVTYSLVGDVGYSVQHWFEKEGVANEPGTGDYELIQTTTDTAPAFSSVTAAILPNYDGFYVQLREEGTVEYPSGTTVLRVFYNREIVALSFDSSGGTYVEPIIGKYETPVTAPVDPTYLGYSFAGWYTDATLTTSASIPSFMPAGDTRFFAKWDAQEVDFSVVYWLENANDEFYSYDQTVIMQADAGSTVTLNDETARSITHFTFSSSNTVTIAGDGSSVINVYYTRNEYTIRFQENDGDLIQNITEKYDADISDIWPVPGHTTSVWQSNITGYYYTALDKMTGYDMILTEYSWSGNTYRWYYYIEILPGESTSGTRQYDGRYFKLYRTSSVKANSLVLTFDEDFYPIDGFSRYASVPAFSSWTSEGTAPFNSERKAYLYYKRASYILEFINYNSTLSTESILYEQDISGKNIVDPVQPGELQSQVPVFRKAGILHE